MWHEILVGLGAGATFLAGSFSIGKWTMRRAWKKNELELRAIQKDLIPRF